MHLTDYLQQELVFGELSASSKTDVIRELASKICKVKQDLNSTKITEILLEREKLGSTGIDDGVAIPHGKIPGLKNIVVACGRKKEGIQFDSHDGKPSKIFFVLLAPEEATALHLKVLARLSRLLKDDFFRTELLKAGDSKQIFQTIIDEDNK